MLSAAECRPRLPFVPPSLSLALYLHSLASKRARNHFVFCPIIETQRGSKGEIRMGAPFELDLFASSFLPSFLRIPFDDGGRDNGAEGERGSVEIGYARERKGGGS